MIGIDRHRTDEFRMADGLRRLPEMSSGTVDRADRAWRRLAIRCDKTEFRVTFPFRPGDCMVFDHRGILQDREAFAEGEGGAHLRGRDVRGDDLLSLRRFLARADRQACR